MINFLKNWISPGILTPHLTFKSLSLPPSFPVCFPPSLPERGPTTLFQCLGSCVLQELNVASKFWLLEIPHGLPSLVIHIKSPLSPPPSVPDSKALQESWSHFLKLTDQFCYFRAVAHSLHSLQLFSTAVVSHGGNL
jgi:hypothetical protein